MEERKQSEQTLRLRKRRQVEKGNEDSYTLQYSADARKGSLSRFEFEFPYPPIIGFGKS